MSKIYRCDKCGTDYASPDSITTVRSIDGELLVDLCDICFGRIMRPTVIDDPLDAFDRITQEDDLDPYSTPFDRPYTPVVPLVSRPPRHHREKLAPIPQGMPKIDLTGIAPEDRLNFSE